MEILFVFLAFMLGSGGYMAVEHLLSKPKAIPTKYDPHYTRKLEQQEFGYILTTCEDNECKECFPPKAIEPVRTKQLGPGRTTQPWEKDPRYKGYRQEDIDFQDRLRKMTRERLLAEEKAKKAAQKCSVCKVPLDYDGWCSNGCVKAYRDSIKKSFEKSLADSNYRTHIVLPPARRTRKIGKIEVPIPDAVPDHAHGSLYYDTAYLSDYVVWKWMDEESGEVKFLKSAPPLQFDEPKFDYVLK